MRQKDISKRHGVIEPKGWIIRRHPEDGELNGVYRGTTGYRHDVWKRDEFNYIWDETIDQ
jgi:hypothetical protein